MLRVLANAMVTILVLAFSSAAVAAVPTFTKDIAPILLEHCANCHGSLLSYDAARSSADAIREKVATRAMPPWPADPARSLKFRNDARLSESQIATVLAWIDAGTPKGDDPGQRRQPDLASEWLNPEGRAPDAIVSLPVIHSSNSVNPKHEVVDMAYAHDGTATFNNVVAAAAGPHTLAIRYAYSTGLFGGVLNRPEGIKVNGALVTAAMDFPVTGDFEAYQTASIVVNLRAGANSIQLFNLDGASISRADTLTVTPAASGACVTLPPTPVKLSGLAQSATQINLGWSASVAPASCSVKSYDVFRSTNHAFIPSADNEIASGLTTAAYSDNKALCNLTYYYSVAAVDEAGSSVPSLPFTVSTNGCPASSTVQINSGGSTVSSWSADEEFSGGSAIATGDGIQTVNIPKGLPLEVFQNARTGNFSYTVKGFKPASSHTVTLYFLEPILDSVGSRLFNVSINGTTVLSNFDVFLAAGDNNTPVAEKISAAADSSGQYVITFTPVLNEAVLSGLQIK